MKWLEAWGMLLPTAGLGTQGTGTGARCPPQWGHGDPASTTLKLSLSSLRLNNICAEEILAEFLWGRDFLNSLLG